MLELLERHQPLTCSMILKKSRHLEVWLYQPHVTKSLVTGLLVRTQNTVGTVEPSEQVNQPEGSPLQHTITVLGPEPHQLEKIMISNPKNNHRAHYAFKFLRVAIGGYRRASGKCTVRRQCAADSEKP